MKKGACPVLLFPEENFSTAGGAVAILTTGMKKKLTVAALLLAMTLSATAQEWSIGVHSGAFVFGDFVERRTRPSTGGGSSGTNIVTLSAATRAGLSIDLERELAERWALRLEGTFTRSPLAVKSEDDDEFALDAGEVDIATFTVPLVFRINPRGSFRFHLMAGPAYAVYRITGTPNASGITPLDLTRNEWGLLAGGGVAWWTSDRFAIEGNFSDVVTSSPFDREDFPPGPGWSIEEPHNVHTTAGVRWRF